jgi:hypothetical protein
MSTDAIVLLKHDHKEILEDAGRGHQVIAACHVPFSLARSIAA